MMQTLIDALEVFNTPYVLYFILSIAAGGATILCEFFLLRQRRLRVLQALTRGARARRNQMRISER